MGRRRSRLLTSASTLSVTAAVGIAACGSGSPHSVDSPSASSSGRHLTGPQIQEDAVRFSGCMRSHNVPGFPDPTTAIHAFKIALNPTTLSEQPAAFKRAYLTCQRLLPGGVPSSQSATASHAQAVAFLAFARCLRSHGFSRFPDPPATGSLTHELLAAAGIDVHQPAFLREADTCTSVTHGAMTRSAVARFVAGQ